MILVACIGNIFLGDDGFGVEVARRLAARPLPADVVVRDFGIRGFDLAYALLDHQGLAILVDACPRGGTPGTLYLIEPADTEPNNDGAHATEPVGLPETHSMNPMRVLEMVRAMRGSAERGSAHRILLVGCEPADFGPENEGRMGLSDPVQAAVDPAIAMIERLIEERTQRSENVHGIDHTCIER
jgi:hydrogenase maturation protease